ncbi:MAG: DNA polymerase I [Bacteroidetes bacterium]|nr:DNA polymerase I [Bacteroidota bacterium]
MKKIFLIDAMAMAYKAYFAFINRPLRNSKGQNTSAVYGFFSSLLKILEKEKPDYLAVAFDLKDKTFRHEKFPEYKATRQEMPEEMIYQIDYIKQILEAMDVAMLSMPGFEADDIIGTLVHKLKQNNFEIYLVTPDKDYFQLINDQTFIYKPAKSMEDAELIDKNKLLEKMELSPSQIIDFLALTGDSSDNIPGVKGIGEKTALELLKEFQTLDNIYKDTSKVTKANVRKKLEEQKESAYLSKELVTINLETPISFQLEDFTVKKSNLRAVDNILNELEIRSLKKRIHALYDLPAHLPLSDKFGGQEESLFIEEGSVSADELSDQLNFDAQTVKYHLIQTENELQTLIGKINRAKKFVFDTETNNLNAIDARLVGISFCVSEKEAYFIKFERHTELPLNSVLLDLLKPIFADEKILKIGQNLKYDMTVLKKYGIKVEGPLFDTMVASYIINSSAPNNLDELAIRHLNYSTIKLTELIGAKKNPELMWDAPIDLLKNYSCEDADITFRLYNKLSDELEKHKLTELCEKIEFPLVKTLTNMELTGVQIDCDELAVQQKEIEHLLELNETEIFKQSKEKFNINSPKQLQEILFNKLKLEAVKKTKTGFSTDIQALEQIRYSHPIIENIIGYRQLSKLKNTDIEALPKIVNPTTGRIHTSYNQTVTATGRLSSADPNLQNIPIRTELGREIRKAFTAPDKNWLILSADYSQIELRIMAHICEDKNLIAAFENDLDIHTNTASLIYNCSIKDVTPEMRRKAKEVNFGILYGIGAYGLKVRLGIAQSEAKEIIDKYFKKYPKVQEYLDSTIEFARKNGFVETLMKRRRYLPNINSKNFSVRSFEERAAINMPIQGTAADMIKIAMNNIDREFENQKVKSKMIMQVHDELVFEVHKSELDKVKKLIETKMVDAIPLKVPVKVDIGVGDNWLDAH